MTDDFRRCDDGLDGTGLRTVKNDEAECVLFAFSRWPHEVFFTSRLVERPSMFTEGVAYYESWPDRPGRPCRLELKIVKDGLVAHSETAMVSLGSPLFGAANGQAFFDHIVAVTKAIVAEKGI